MSRESATCRYIDTDRHVTFPIDETHSNMVKFTRNSPDYEIVIDKLCRILEIMRGAEFTTDYGHTNSVYGQNTPFIEPGLSVSHIPIMEDSLQSSTVHLTGR